MTDYMRQIYILFFKYNADVTQMATFWYLICNKKKTNKKKNSPKQTGFHSLDSQKNHTDLLHLLTDVSNLQQILWKRKQYTI